MMTKSILAAAVGAFLLAGTAMAGPTQTKTARTPKASPGAMATASAKAPTHRKKHRRVHHRTKTTASAPKPS